MRGIHYLTTAPLAVSSYGTKIEVEFSKISIQNVESINVDCYFRKVQVGKRKKEEKETKGEKPDDVRQQQKWT